MLNHLARWWRQVRRWFRSRSRRERWAGDVLKPVEGAFYVSGPLVCHLVKDSGKDRIDTHYAEYDGIGWRVYRSERIEFDIEAALVDLAEMIDRENMHIPGMEVLAAKLGSPGTDHQLARMKTRRDTVINTRQLLASLQNGTKA